MSKLRLNCPYILKDNVKLKYQINENIWMSHCSDSVCAQSQSPYPYGAGFISHMAIADMANLLELLLAMVQALSVFFVEVLFFREFFHHALGFLLLCGASEEMNSIGKGMCTRQTCIFR